MNYSHIKYFVTAAHYEHYGNASEQLMITQSTLSRAIESLEDELGTPLFEKIGRNVRLTQAGHVFLRYCENAINEIDQGVEMVQLISSGMRGELRINSIYVENNWLSRHLGQFMKENPQVMYSNYQFPTRQIIQNVLDGKTDLGFIAEGFNLDRDFKDLAYEVYREEEIVMICSASHRFASRTDISFAELENEPIVSFPPKESGFYHIIREQFVSRQLPYEPSHYLTDDYSLCNCVANGLGISFVDITTARMMANALGSLHLVRLRDCTRKKRLLMIWKKDRKLPIVTKNFIRFIENQKLAKIA